jgi:hypothetical protein
MYSSDKNDETATYTTGAMVEPFLILTQVGHRAVWTGQQPFERKVLPYIYLFLLSSFRSSIPEN